ncbi:MAG: hypothetical protein O8C61_08430 [Candidatus Methanoperedens sp.]|nr:hypothetical protein [Candidatus Methanoperedens sp.]
MRPSLQPRKHSLYPNKEANESVQKIHEKRMGKGTSKKTLYVFIILAISSIIIAFLTLPIVVGAILILAAVSISLILIKPTTSIFERLDKQNHTVTPTIKMEEQNHTATPTAKMEDRVNLNYSNEYDKEQLKENLIRLEEKFRNSLLDEGDYRTTKEKYQSMLYEYEHVKLEENSFKASPKYKNNHRTTEKKSSGVAAIASFFYSGLGQIYNGQILKGLVIILLHTILNICTIFLIITSPLLIIAILVSSPSNEVDSLVMIFLILIILNVILKIYSIYDAYNTAIRTWEE